uniref:Flotillin n=1 Tax=Equus caballus TaxID=9796 RepID=A0A9L0S4W3_HORSE
MTLQPRCEDVETAEGVALTVTGVAQVKIMTEKELLAVACEQFLGKNVQDIKNVVLQTLEGHLRSILGTLTVEQIYQDRDQFAKLVREVAAPDVGRMGIEILSFTIKDVYDKVDYLSSLGKTQTAVVQRDADIGVAEAERDAGIREAECKKEMLDVKFMADTKIADSKRAFELQKSAFSEEVNIKTAEAQLAYELQGAREQQKIRQEEIEIEIVQRKKQIAVEAQEILRVDKELIATVRRPAEAEAHRIQQIAEGDIRSEPTAGRAACLCACPHRRGPDSDTPDQEGHQCTGVRLLRAHTLQQLPTSPFSTRFNTTATTGALLTLVPYFVGTRSAACAGLLWLSSLLSCLCLLPLLLFPTPSLSLPCLSGLSLPPSSPCLSLHLSVFFPLSSRPLHTSCSLS